MMPARPCAIPLHSVLWSCIMYLNPSVRFVERRSSRERSGLVPVMAYVLAGLLATAGVLLLSSQGAMPPCDGSLPAACGSP